MVIRTIVATVLLSSAALVAAPQPPPGVPPDTPVLSATTDLVVLPVTVSNRRGEPVAGLRPQDFVVYDNGVPQKVEFFREEDTPVTVGLVIDNSSSMQDKRQDVIDAARAFAESSNPLDQIFLVRFNEAVSMGLPSGMGFTSSVPVLNAALSTISSRGMTALYDAVAAGLRHLEQGQRARKALIVISDGGDDASRISKRAALDMAAHSDAVVYTIGLFDDRDQDRNPGVLKDLAHSTGGEAFFPHRTADVVTTCQQIAATIRAGYTLGYVPVGVGTADGRHTVRVEVHGPDAARLKVSTRPGYTSAPGSGSIEIW